MAKLEQLGKLCKFNYIIAKNPILPFLLIFAVSALLTLKDTNGHTPLLPRMR